MLQREESVLRYGSYGQFKLKSEPKNPLRGANARTDVRTQVGLAASMMSDPVMTGVLTYTSSDSATFGQQIVIPGASIQGYCKVGSTNVYYYSTGTNSAGQFSIACPAGSTSYGGVAKLESPAARIAYGFLNLWLDFPLDIDANVTDTISVIPEMGAVYRYHQIYNLQATTEFLRTRGQMKYVVNPGSNAASKYDTGSDWIQINAGAYWDAFGHFATPHEFGHAFHYTAIDRWRSSSYSCVDNDHGFHTFETTSCAYVEGFADFFAFWMLRNESPTYQFWTNGSIEFNSNPATPPVGIMVEFYFAATLWDMVDDASMSDGIGGDDDGVAITPRDIADIMLKCRLISPNEYLISHTDQFVYCAEYGVNNAAFSLPTTHRQFWGAYGSMTWDGGAPVLPNLTAFRNLWRLNFYAL